MLTTSILMFRFQPLGHDCDPELKSAILVFLGTPMLAQNVQFWAFCYYS